MPAARLSEVLTSKLSVDVGLVPVWVNVMKGGSTARFKSEAVLVIVIAGFSGVTVGAPI